MNSLNFLMEDILKSLNTEIVLGLAPLILILIIGKNFFFKTLEISFSLLLIKNFIILYSFLNVTHFLVGLFFQNEIREFLERASGSYAGPYWLMIISALILPFSLFKKSLAQNIYYLLFIAVIMKIGWYLEIFTIISINLNRDYLPDELYSISILPSGIIAPYKKGFSLGFLLLILSLIQ